MKKKRYKNILDAIKANDIEGVKLFLPEHANDKDKYGYTALLNTISAGNKQMFDLLLDNGADPYSGTDGYPILHYLWIHNWSDKIQTLVDQGLDLNSTNPLMITEVCSFLGIENQYSNDRLIFLKELLRYGARTDIPDEYGKFPHKYGTLPLDYLPNEVRVEIEAYIANIESERQGNIASETGFAYDV